MKAAVEGVFVLGAEESGVDVVHAALCGLGTRSLGAGSEPGPSALASFADALLETLGGTAERLPGISPREASRLLSGSAAEARRQFRMIESEASPSDGSRPWAWADHRLSFLALFWEQVLGISPAAVLIHRDPRGVAAACAAHGGGTESLERWARLNLAALTVCSEIPSLVISYERLCSEPGAVVSELSRFLAECEIPGVGTVSDVVRTVEARSLGAAQPGGAPAPVDRSHLVLSNLLTRLDGRFATGIDVGPSDMPQLVDATRDFYDEHYYDTSLGPPYRRSQTFWTDFFSGVAGSIVESLHPKATLDVGCATGMLVEALRERGVDARGIDISEWAIGQIPDALRPFCRVGSITDELEGRYDLITCIEVLEHLPPPLAVPSVANLCRHADVVLFSSTPSDFDEPSHLNVEPSGYWAQLFSRQGFLRDVDYDATFLAPHAVLFRRREVDTEGLIADYERALSTTMTKAHARVVEAVAEHDRLAVRYGALAEETHRINKELARVEGALGDAERRRNAETHAAFDMVRHYEAQQRRLASLVSVRDAELESIRNTKTFRYTARLRRVYSRLRGSGPADTASTDAPPSLPDGSYALWVEQFDTLDEAGRTAIRDRVAQAAVHPSISVIMPVYDPSVELLRVAIDSVIRQLYPDWELCIADDASTRADVRQLLDEYRSSDSRIKLVRRDVNGHISAACNTALTIATGDWIVCLDHDDVLAEHALALAAEAIARKPGSAIVYSDEDKIDERGARSEPFFKPDFDPLQLLGQNYINHMCLLRRDLVTLVDGYREGYEGSQDWDLLLRVSEQVEPRQIVHIPHVLYHWRAHTESTALRIASKPYAVDSGQRAVQDHLDRSGELGSVTRIPISGHNRIRWSVPDPAPSISIVIPTRDGTLLQRCIDSIFVLTSYPNFEVFVVDNSSGTLATLAFLRDYDDRLTVIRDERPFNYAAINNAAVRRTTGEMICLLNDDTEVISGDWLTELVSHVVRPGVGAVGAKLYYDDGRIQHAGTVLGILGVAGHSHRRFDRLSPGYFGRLQIAHTVSAVTAACVVVRREAWEAAGGMDEENLPIAFNDVDFCLRLGEAGWRVVWSPYAELFHHESVSRGSDDEGPRSADFAREIRYMQNRWGRDLLRHDPYYNPNLSLDCEDFSLAWPPRVSYR